MCRTLLLIFIFIFGFNKYAAALDLGFLSVLNPCSWKTCTLTEKWNCDLNEGLQTQNNCKINRSEEISRTCPPYNRGMMCKSRPGCLKQFDYPGDFGGNWAAGNLTTVLSWGFNVTALKVAGVVNSAIEAGTNVNVMNVIFDELGFGPLYNACAQSPVTEAYMVSKDAETFYFNPNIKVYLQGRSPEVYFYTGETLGLGECTILPTGFAISAMARFCARIAVPPTKGLAKKGISFGGLVFDPPVGDPGYTSKKHIDDEGVTRADPKMYDDAGVEIDIDPVKICAYEDPDLITSGTNLIGSILGADLFDFNPISQPMHSNSGAHPLIKFMVATLQAGIEITKVMLKLPPIIQGLNMATGEMLFKTVDFLFALVGKFAAQILQVLGQMNRVVTTESLGCVSIPLGPFPCRYCPRIEGFSPTLEVQKICAMDKNGFIEEPNMVNKCTLSDTIDNNAINNAIRVGFSMPVPFCVTGTEPLGTCIKFVGALDAFSAHFVYKDLIRTCGSAGAGSGCVDPISAASVCSTLNLGSSGCPQKFRLVYGYQIGDIFTNTASYYMANIDGTKTRGQAKLALASGLMFQYTKNSYDDKCGYGTGVPNCRQTLWGVNFGDYRDIQVNFSTPNQVGPITSSTTLAYGKDVYNIQAKIFTDNDQSAQNICAFVNNQAAPLGCVGRPEVPSPILYNNYASTHLNPILDAKIEIRPRDSLAISTSTRSLSSTVIIPNTQNKSFVSSLQANESFFTPPTFSAMSVEKVNFAGFLFEAYVTDDTYKVKPFTPNNCGVSYTGSNLWCGTYYKNIMPIKVNSYGQFYVNTDALYMYGLEYMDVYTRGAKYMCLGPIKSSNCLANTEDCVLAKKISIGSNKKIISKSPQDRIIPSPGPANIANLKYSDVPLQDACRNYLSWYYNININQCSNSVQGTFLTSLMFTPYYNSSYFGQKRISKAQEL